MANQCPYCGNPLAKTPGRKTKCPHCGGFIYVRTRPSDRKSVLATKEQADAIEAEWRMVTDSQYRMTPEKVDQIKKESQAMIQRNLLSYLDAGVIHVKILGTPDSCENCKAKNGQKIRIDLILNKPIEEVTGCMNPFCRCDYLAVLKDKEPAGDAPDAF